MHLAALEKYFVAKVDDLAQARPNELTRDSFLQMLNPAILQQLSALIQPTTSTA